ncbi:T9SS type A sorting domain-containing protein [Lacinutrix algicola]|uniref:T9SS type A sorting domain-containing protein n=1 Tax=Lacinutrix algicola TaxID=342954 RepID=UPI0006E34878|nr:T9SS type A sorting domain-containing protein [Lacinutrix algicola]
MKKIYSLLLTVLITSAAFGQNEFTNGSFETFTGGVPTDWHGDRSSISTSSVNQSTEAQDGSSSVALVAGGSSHKRFTNGAITATNEEYKLSYYYKGNGDLRNAFHDGGYSSYTSYTSVNTTVWTLMEYTFTPDAGNLEVIFSVRNTSGDGVLIDNATLVPTATLSTQEVEKATFSMYPNPTSNGFVNIKTSNNAATQVAVYDILGKQVINTTLNGERLNVSKLNAGVYAVRLSQGNTVTTKKLMVK